ncbi:hypothetical protein RRG08_034597 [Elysia crispata]|uniref:Uncharacterized protein n=1 Tax=Elysia crispata TaxID=231223 RepID=A0AAE1B348_9GAST|nr:hypothetical protein RRG08_034597 [Elysia crispata]
MTVIIVVVMALCARRDLQWSSVTRAVVQHSLGRQAGLSVKHWVDHISNTTGRLPNSGLKGIVSEEKAKYTSKCVAHCMGLEEAIILGSVFKLGILFSVFVTPCFFFTLPFLILVLGSSLTGLNLWTQGGRYKRRAWHGYIPGSRFAAHTAAPPALLDLLDIFFVCVAIGEDIKHPTKRYVQAREPDKRMAYIVLGDGQEFTFPDLFADKPPPMEREMKEMRRMKRDAQVERRQSWEREAVPPWFR